MPGSGRRGLDPDQVQAAHVQRDHVRYVVDLIAAGVGVVGQVPGAVDEYVAGVDQVFGDPEGSRRQDVGTREVDAADRAGLLAIDVYDGHTRGDAGERGVAFFVRRLRDVGTRVAVAVTDHDPLPFVGLSRRAGYPSGEQHLPRKLN